MSTTDRSRPWLRFRTSVLPRWAAISLVMLATTSGAPASLAQSDPDPAADCGAGAAEYRPIHRLEIPLASGFHAVPPPYAFDDSGADIPYFDRIAYCLSLDSGNGADWVFVSMKAFTDDLGAIGVPAGADATVHQALLENMEVASNVPGIPTGSDIESGNIEFWPHNYAPANAAGVPGASDGLYDTGDAINADVPAGYGSMQIHDHASGTTLLAYNAWGQAGRAPDLGIGNSPQGHPDWTFEANGAGYETRRLWVLVREAEPPALSMRIDAPTGRMIQQRDARDEAQLRVRGKIGGSRMSDFVTRGTLWARAEAREGRGSSTNWEALDRVGPGGEINGSLRLSGGWYDLHFRAELDGQNLARAELARVGVGEVFLTAGQSNSANHGLPPLRPADDRVSAMGLAAAGWRQAYDPQPIATGNGGTPWPVLGDLLAEALDRPIGFVSVGWGGTRVDQWSDPAGNLYPRIRQALADLPASVDPESPRLRAILWHQGESDTAAGTSTGLYAARLGMVIARSRSDAGFELPWVLARASFLPATGPGPEVIAAQNQLIAQDPRVLAGPETDDLVGSAWRYDRVHFNEAGLREHARRWAEALLAWPELVATPAPSATPLPTATTSASDTPPPTAVETRTSTPTTGPGDARWTVMLPRLTLP